MEEKRVKRLPKEKISMVEQQVQYAKNLARQFYRQRPKTGVDLEDFEGAALLGLCDAACRFDVVKGMNFQTFAYFRIRGAMLDLLRRGGGMSWVFSSRSSPCLPRDGSPQGPSLEMAEKRTDNQSVDTNHVGQAPPSTSDSRDTTFVFRRNLCQFLRFSDVLAHAGMQLHTNAGCEIEDVSYLGNSTPEEIIVHRQTNNVLKRLLGRLTKKERLLVELRYYKGYSFEEIQGFFGGASKSWVSRLHGKALDSLRELIEGERVQSENALRRQAA